MLGFARSALASLAADAQGFRDLSSKCGKQRGEVEG
jgi:hypothetical protein